MTHVATLVSNPGQPALSFDLLQHVSRLLPDAQSIQWLDEAVAADVRFISPSTDALSAIRALLNDVLAETRIDFFLQPLAMRRKKLLIADMDSTMIGQECIDELADFIGQKTLVASITERAMRGEIAFEPALRERVALLQGLGFDVIDKVIAQRITFNPGARALVQTMRAQGAYTALVSGGFTLFAEPVRAMLGFDACQANVLIVENSRLTGRVSEPILGKAAKREALEHFCQAQGISTKQSLAVGDGANDLAMLEQAGLGVAYRAKPAVAAAAQARIEHADLTALLYAQGYKKSEFRH